MKGAVVLDVQVSVHGLSLKESWNLLGIEVLRVRVGRLMGMKGSCLRTAVLGECLRSMLEQ